MSTATQAPVAGHETNGRFAQGNPGGPGNPFGRRLAANRTAILDCVGPDEINRLFSSLLEQAMGGNMAAARLVLLYAVGKPQAQKEPDLLDVEEFEVAKAKRVPHGEAVTALLGMPIQEAIEMAGSKPLLHDDPEEDRLDREEEAAEAAAAKEALAAEANRVLSHVLEHGDWPADCAFAMAEKECTPEQVAEFRRFFAQCMREGKFPDDSPFAPFGNGAPADRSREVAEKLAAKMKKPTVCTVS